MLSVAQFNIKTRARQLELVFSSGERCQLPFEYLRVCSPATSAKQGLPANKKMVQLIAIEPVAKHGYRLLFDDRHSAIYALDYLGQLYRDYDQRWQQYLQQLQQAGLSREPSIDIKQL